MRWSEESNLRWAFLAANNVLDFGTIGLKRLTDEVSNALSIGHSHNDKPLAFQLQVIHLVAMAPKCVRKFEVAVV